MAEIVHKFGNGRPAVLGDPVIGIVEGALLIGVLMSIDVEGKAIVDRVLRDAGGVVGHQEAKVMDLNHGEDILRASSSGFEGQATIDRLNGELEQERKRVVELQPLTGEVERLTTVLNDQEVAFGGQITELAGKLTAAEAALAAAQKAPEADKPVEAPAA